MISHSCSGSTEPDLWWDGAEPTSVAPSGRAQRVDQPRRQQRGQSWLDGMELMGRSLSHYLSNDLTRALGFAELLLSQKLVGSDQGRELLAEMIEGLEAAAGHVHQLGRLEYEAIQDTPHGPILNLNHELTRQPPRRLPSAARP